MYFWKLFSHLRGWKDVYFEWFLWIVFKSYGDAESLQRYLLKRIIKVIVNQRPFRTNKK